MYNLFYVIIFGTFCTVRTTSSQINKTALQMTCKNFSKKYSSMENSVCVKLTLYGGEKRREIFIIEMNEFEVNLANCKECIDAAIVPMKNCKHNFIMSQKVKSRQNRIKRHAHNEMKGVDSLGIGERAEDDEDDNDDATKKPAQENDYVSGDKANNDEMDSIEITGEDNKKLVQIWDENKDIKISGMDIDKKLEHEHYDKNEEEPNMKENDNFEVLDDTITKYEQDIQNQNQTDSGNFDENQEKIDGNAKKSDENQRFDLAVTDKEDIEQFDLNYDKIGGIEENFVENNDSCPKACPVPKMMVCARCKHNIYRTFLSVCHLRMSFCKNPNEKLELVSRSPCLQSAPYLIDLPVIKTMIPTADDQDTVLKFIRCREKGRLERDPRCKLRH